MTRYIKILGKTGSGKSSSGLLLGFTELQRLIKEGFKPRILIVSDFSFREIISILRRFDMNCENLLQNMNISITNTIDNNEVFINKKFDIIVYDLLNKNLCELDINKASTLFIQTIQETRIITK